MLINCTLSVRAELKLPKLISDGMVLQRNINLNIWGWGKENQKVVVTFNNKQYTTSVSETGEWRIQLPKQKAGGPYTMTIESNNEKLSIKDILIGEVWLCSGQSNMELPMRRVENRFPEEVKNSTNPKIRQFIVPQKYNFNSLEVDFSSGQWKSANPTNVLNFSAVGYFYAKSLYEKYGVPVGVINASLGGSPAEAWMSEDALKQFPDYYNEAQKFKNSDLIKQIETADKERINKWYNDLNNKDEGYRLSHYWKKPSDTSNWLKMDIPGYWSDVYPEIKNGVVWLHKTFNIPSEIAGKPAKLILGRIVDADSAFVNGKFVGNITYQYPPRRYEIPSGVLEEGENTIVVRVVSSSGKGGFVPDKEYDILCGNDTIDLKGEWQLKQGAEMPPLAGETFIRWKPEGLFNAMINPLIQYRIKGFVWYQGESNISNGTEYTALLSTLINDWREKWQQNLPFIYAQLPNFMDAKPQPSESDWALFREAQASALTLPQTGMSVNIDLGEWNDIHPLNKKEVAERLSLLAQRIAYGDKKAVAFSPMYQSMKIEGNKIRIRFKNNKDLVVKGGEYINNFAVAAADGKFVWAKAKIEKNSVIVWSDDVANPVSVRYAWADNPENINFYNKAGLPVAPFQAKK